MKRREYDPRTKHSLVGSITAGWRDEQKNRPRSRSRSARGKTYSGAPQSHGDQALEKEEDLMAGSSADLMLSSKVRLQNISSAVKKVSEQEEEHKRPSFSKKVRSSMRQIFVNKTDLLELEFDFGDVDPTQINQGHHEDETGNDTSQRNSRSTRDASRVNDSSRSEGRGNIPVLAGKIRDSKRGRSRSLKRKKEEGGKEVMKGSRADENPAETGNTAKIRSRSEGLIGRMRRRSDEKRKRRGARGSVSPTKRRTSRLRTPSTQRETFRSPTTSDVPKGTMENSSRLESSISLLEEAQMASDIVRAARRDSEEKERERTLSTHESRTGSDFFSDPAQDGSLRSSSSRHSRTVADILMESSSASIPAMSQLRTQILSDNSHPHNSSAPPSRLNSPLVENKVFEASESSMPHLSPFSSVSTSMIQLPLSTGGAPFFGSDGQVTDPLQSDETDGEVPAEEPKQGSKDRRQKTSKARQSSGEPYFDADVQRVMRPLGSEGEKGEFHADKVKQGSNHGRRTSKARRKSDNLQSSANLIESHVKTSSRSRPSKDQNESSHRRRERSKMSSSDRTHEVRRSRLTKDEPSHRRRSLQVEPAEGYGSLLEKQTQRAKRTSTMNSSSRRRNTALLDSSESQLKSRRHSRSAHGRSKTANTKANETGAEKRNSVLRKSRRQQSKPKTRSHSEGGRKKSSQNASRLSHSHQEQYAASDNEQDSMKRPNMGLQQMGDVSHDLLGKVLTINFDEADPIVFETQNTNVPSENTRDIQMALNPSALENSSLPFEGGGLDRTKLTHSQHLEADMISPEPRSYHPRTSTMTETTSDAAMSKSYHVRSQSLLMKQSSRKKVTDSSNRKKKTKSSSANIGFNGKDMSAVDLSAVDPNSVETLLRSNGLEGKDLNEVDLTALDPEQVKSVLLRGSSSRNREASGGETRIGRKSRRTSTRPRRAASEQIQSRSNSRIMAKEEKPVQRKKMTNGNHSTKNFDNKSERGASICRKKIAREYGEEGTSASFEESWRQFVGEVGFG